MYPKNAASPEPIAIGAVVLIADGTVQTSGCTVRIKPVGVAEGDGAGTTAYSTDGIVLYTPTQAETNYTSFVLVAKKASCLPASVTVVPTESSVAGRVSLGAILGTAITGTAAQLAAAFTKFFNVATPTGTVNSLPDAPPDSANGLITRTAFEARTIVAASYATVAAIWAAVVDSAGVTTLLDRIASALSITGGKVAATVATGDGVDAATLAGRLTAARALLLDNLNVGGLVASGADVAAITQAQRVRIILPAQLERPDAGSVAYRIWILAYNEQHQAEDLDGLPTVTAENNAAVDRSVNLSVVTKPVGTTGQYYVDYTVAAAHAIEGLLLKVTATEATVATIYMAAGLVVDTTAVDFTAADRTKLEAVHAKLPTKAFLTGTANNDGDVQLDEATGAPADSAGVGTLLTRASEVRLAELDAANLPADVDTLKARVTEARLAELDAANLPADVDTLKTRVTEARLSELDDTAGKLVAVADAAQKLLRADRKVDKTTNALHWDEVLLEEGTVTELVRRELFDVDGVALAAETTRIGRAIKPAP